MEFNKTIEEEIENLGLNTERLKLLLKFIRSNNINRQEEATLCGFLNEIAYNINAETNNLTAQIIRT